MTRRRQEERRGPRGSALTAVSYFCTLAFALALLWGLGPPVFRGKGLEKKYLPYLVLELPVESARAGEGPLVDGAPGRPHDTILKKQRLGAEEYLVWLRRWTWEGEHLTRRVWGTKYEIYWVPVSAGEITCLPVPVGYDYSVSGDGGAGFVVTVSKKWEPGLLEKLLMD